MRRTLSSTESEPDYTSKLGRVAASLGGLLRSVKNAVSLDPSITHVDLACQQGELEELLEVEPREPQRPSLG